MAKFKKSDINKYYDTRNACYLLSCLLKNPKLALSKDKPYDEDFFINRTHKALYLVVENLAKMGVETIKLADIETYLATHDQLTYARFFGEVGDETEWILSLLEMDTIEGNYHYYYDILQKFAYLRAKLESGQDVTDILDMSEIDSRILDEQYEHFVDMTLEEIIRHYDRLNLEVKHKFSRRSEEDSCHAGEDIDSLLEELAESPDYGWRLSLGRYCDNLVRGARRGNLVVESRNSGTGKTRDALFQCVLLSCHTIWNHETQQFEENPYGDIVPSLYFGTELKLHREVKPIILAFISGVESGKIKKQTLTKEEQERVNRAKEILKESPLYLEREPNYDCMFLENMIENYVTKYDVGAIMIDYVELTPPMISEYVRMTRGLQAREDSVLLNVSTVLKNLAEEFDVFIKIYTQISDNARRDETIRDSGAIKGSKSLQVRADLGLVVMRPTDKELMKIEPIMSVLKCEEPDICLHVYKNRDGDIAEFKVWCKLNLGNYHLQELFVTDWYYRPFKKQMEKSYLHSVFEEDEFGELHSKTVHLVGDSDLPFDLYDKVNQLVEQRRADKKRPEKPKKGINKDVTTKS